MHKANIAKSISLHDNVLSVKGWASIYGIRSFSPWFHFIINKVIVTLSTMTCLLSRYSIYTLHLINSIFNWIAITSLHVISG